MKDCIYLLQIMKKKNQTSIQIDSIPFQKSTHVCKSAARGAVDEDNSLLCIEIYTIESIHSHSVQQFCTAELESFQNFSFCQSKPMLVDFSYRISRSLPQVSSDVCMSVQVGLREM